VLGGADWLNRAVQRALGRRALAAEFTAGDLSADFRANGTVNPDTDVYNDLARDGFARWRLSVGGLVERPGQFSLADLRAMPSRTQITRHDCVEGWSCIGQWTGVRLTALLTLAGLKDNARYIVFRCADRLPGGGLTAPVPYYESIDLNDAFHEQTILAYAMNGQTLPVAHGAPLRLRVERHLGYKHAKYVMAVEAVESFAGIGGGPGQLLGRSRLCLVRRDLRRKTMVSSRRSLQAAVAVLALIPISAGLSGVALGPSIVDTAGFPPILIATFATSRGCWWPWALPFGR
jgi:DMSO/TMAO reductase YedYZ molybdopterin-dependent catalytic subunit